MLAIGYFSTIINGNAFQNQNKHGYLDLTATTIERQNETATCQTHHIAGHLHFN